MAASFKKQLKNIRPRKWSTVKPLWSGYIPDINPPGSPASSPIRYISELASISAKTPDSGKYDVWEDHWEIRSQVLHDGIFLLHKASNLLGASLKAALEGFPTSALISGYQSAFFAGKSISHLFGVVNVNVPNNKTLLIDVWGKPEELTAKQRKLLVKPKYRIVSIASSLLRHDQHWAVILKLLRGCDVASLNGEVLRVIENIEYKLFNRQRNDIYYIDNFWPIINDLHSYYIVPEFPGYMILNGEMVYIDPSDIDFSIRIAMMVFYIGLEMLKDLALAIPLVKPEYDTIVSSLDRDCFERYHIIYDQIKNMTA